MVASSFCRSWRARRTSRAARGSTPPSSAWRTGYVGTKLLSRVCLPGARTCCCEPHATHPSIHPSHIINRWASTWRCSAGPASSRPATSRSRTRRPSTTASGRPSSSSVRESVYALDHGRGGAVRLTRIHRSARSSSIPLPCSKTKTGGVQIITGCNFIYFSALELFTGTGELTVLGGA